MDCFENVQKLKPLKVNHNFIWRTTDGIACTPGVYSLLSFRATVDTVLLGDHDLRFMAAQTIPVDEVFSHPHDGTFPPTFDLTLIKLSVPARIGIKYSSRMGYFSSLI